MTVNTVPADSVLHDSNGKRYVFAGPSNRQSLPRYSRCRGQQLTPRLDLVKEGGVVAIDVEGVRLFDEVGIRTKGIGRVSIVNEYSQIILDAFCFYPEGVNHDPPPSRFKLGVYRDDIKPENGAQPVSELLRWAEAACKKAGAVVVHSHKDETHYMAGGTVVRVDGTLVDIGGFELSQLAIYDTQMFPEYREYAKGNDGKPGLKTLAAEVLGRRIQVEEHSSVEDARATMELFLRRRPAFEALTEPTKFDIPDVTEEMVVSPMEQSDTSADNTEDVNASAKPSYAAMMSKPSAKSATEPTATNLARSGKAPLPGVARSLSTVAGNVAPSTTPASENVVPSTSRMPAKPAPKLTSTPRPNSAAETNVPVKMSYASMASKAGPKNAASPARGPLVLGPSRTKFQSIVSYENTCAKGTHSPE